MNTPPQQFPSINLPSTTPSPQYFYFVILLAVLIGFLYLLIYGLGIASIAANWAENRCKPQVMPFAALYGYNTADNFNYCMKNLIAGQAGTSLGPVYQILATFVGTLSTLLASANSLRLSLATLVGGVTQVFQEFTERFNALLVQVRISSLRMKMLFNRLFSTFYSIMYMGMSGITAVDNFGDTFLFKFLDTFCFDPDTIVEIQHKSQHKSQHTLVRDVKIGDIFSKNGARVTAIFAFIATGQPMVKLNNNILVSTNHYLKHNGKYIMARSHPDAFPISPAREDRPLICFNTDTHIIPIGPYEFLDYDETETANGSTMERLKAQVNGQANATAFPLQSIMEYSPGVSATTEIRLKGGDSIKASEIVLGQQLSTGRVIGVIQKEVDSWVIYNGDAITASTLIWSDGSWKRAYEITEPRFSPTIGYAFIVSPVSIFETTSGTFLRDYIEVLSPDSEADYTVAIDRATPCPT